MGNNTATPQNIGESSSFYNCNKDNRGCRDCGMSRGDRQTDTVKVDPSRLTKLPQEECQPQPKYLKGAETENNPPRKEMKNEDVAANKYAAGAAATGGGEHGVRGADTAAAAAEDKENQAPHTGWHASYAAAAEKENHEKQPHPSQTDGCLRKCLMTQHDSSASCANKPNQNQDRKKVYAAEVYAGEKQRAVNGQAAGGTAAAYAEEEERQEEQAKKQQYGENPSEQGLQAGRVSPKPGGGELQDGAGILSSSSLQLRVVEEARLREEEQERQALLRVEEAAAAAQAFLIEKEELEEKQRSALQEQRRQRELEAMQRELVTNFLRQHGFKEADWVNGSKKKGGFLKSGFQFPLHTAVENNDPAMAQLLLLHGAYPNIADSKGRTPLQMAQAQNKKGRRDEVIDVLSTAAVASVNQMRIN